MALLLLAGLGIVTGMILRSEDYDKWYNFKDRTDGN